MLNRAACGGSHQWGAMDGRCYNLAANLAMTGQMLESLRYAQAIKALSLT